MKAFISNEVDKAHFKKRVEFREQNMKTTTSSKIESIYLGT